MLSKLLASCFVVATLPTIGHASEGESGSVLRAIADPRGAYRWELLWNSVALYDASTSRLIRRFALEGAVQSPSRDFRPPDLVISRDGIAHVTSNVQPVIWRIHPASHAAERVELEVDFDRAKDFGFTSLGWSADASTLYAASSNDGAPWRLDPVAGKAFKLQAAADRDCGSRK